MNNEDRAHLTPYKEKGYEIEGILGTNRGGGRVTYLARESQDNQKVVIKEFQFAKSQNTWSDFEAYEREIEVLKQLSFPNVPKYLATIETPNGFALIQEYKNAIPLSQIDDLTLEEIKEIAHQILEVLVYLQSHKPPIFHRDLKPENILLDRQEPLQVYLIDFGFARKGSDDLAMSSVIKGTLGFMPPEQLYNQRITKASDLYGLGMTIVSLLTKIPSAKIGELIDHQGQLNYKNRLQFIVERKFIKWLDKMVDTNLNNRFPDAQTALNALKNLEQFSFFNSLLNLPRPALISGLSKVATVAILLLIGYSLIPPSPSYPPLVIPSDKPDLIINNGNLLSKLRMTKECKNCDLRDQDLSGMNLEGVNLMGADLSNSNLRKIRLQGANLKGANLSDTDLSNSNLSNANLMGADLSNANLSNSHFENANLSNANLEDTNLTNTVFWKAQLRGARFRDANVKEANFKGAILPDGSIFTD